MYKELLIYRTQEENNFSIFKILEITNNIGISVYVKIIVKNLDRKFQVVDLIHLGLAHH